MKKMFYKNNYTIIFLGIFVTLLITYSPAVLGYYAHLDDYSHFWGWERKEFHNFPHYYKDRYAYQMGCGRFLWAVFFIIYEWAAPSIRDLNMVRLLIIFNLSLCAFICFYWMNKNFSNTLLSFLFSISIFTLPPFEVMASYAMSLPISFAIIFSSLASMLSSRVILIKSFYQVMINKYTIVAILLLMCSLMIYQPAAMFYWIFVALFILFSFEKKEEVIKQIRNIFFIGLTAIGIYAVIIQLMKGIGIFNFYHIYNPIYMTKNYIGKLKWFIERPLKDSLNLWNIFPTVTQAFRIVVFIFVSCLLSFYQTIRNHGFRYGNVKVVLKKIICLLLFIILIFLSYLPNLLAAFNFPWYRSSLVLTTLILIILLWAVNEWVVFLATSRRKIILTVILGVTCIWGLTQAYRNVLYYRVIPSSLEVQHIKTTLQKYDLTKFHTIYFIRLRKSLIAKQARYDEFGVVSTTDGPFTIIYPYLIKCILRELGMQAYLIPETVWIVKYLPNKPGIEKHNFHYLHVSSGIEGQPFLVDPETLVIDMTKLYGYNKIYARHSF